MTDDMVRRISDLEARVAALEARRDEQVTEETRRVVRKVVHHRDAYQDGGEHPQLVLGFRQVVALADLIESIQPALTGVSPQSDQGTGPA